MRLNGKNLFLLAAMVCSVSAAASTRGSLRRRLDMDMQQQLDLAALGLIASPEAALHSEFLREAVYEKGGGKSSDTKKEAKAPKGRKTPAPSPLFEQPTGGGGQPPAPTNAPTFPLVSLPSARQPTSQKTKQPTVEKTKQPTVEKTKQPTVEKTKQPTVEKTEKTKKPTVEKTKKPTFENTKSPTAEKTKGKNGQASGGSKAPSPMTAPSPQEKTKGKTSKGEGQNGGGKGKKGDIEVTESDDVTAVGKVAGGDSFLGKLKRLNSLLSIMIFLSSALTSFSFFL